jgi:hypothetical protein
MRENYYVVNEGILTADAPGNCERPSTEAELRKFRFSRVGPKGTPVDPAVLEKVAKAMTLSPGAPPATQPVSDPPVPAGFTYLGQFIDHDLTKDVTDAALGDTVTVNQLLQGRSPSLDLDSLYGRGPEDAEHDLFYAPDKAKLKVGLTAAITGPGTNLNLNGYDLPRVTQGSKKAERQAAQIPDKRNDENLAVAQTHLAFMRFHNRVVDMLADDGVPGNLIFERARGLVVRHYQWMLKTDYLPQIVDQSTVDDVFTNGRRFFELPVRYDERADHDRDGNGRYAHQKTGDRPTMPIEFSVAAFRLGHSMVRSAYNWNRIFAGDAASLRLLFIFSGTSGNFNPFEPDINNQESGLFERLPTNWTVDWRRMFDLDADGTRPELAAPGGLNLAQRIDTMLVDPLAELPEGTFGFGTRPTPIELNLAFRNLVRANMVNLASGQEMADFLGIPQLKPEDIIRGSGTGAVLDAADALTAEEQAAFASRTPLWFYILREAELNGGKLTGVGGQIVVEVFHRAMEGSRISIVRDPAWRPSLGDGDRFTMVDLLLFAFENNRDLLAPLGD